MLPIASLIQDILVWSRDSPIGIAKDPKAGVVFPAGARDSSVLHWVMNQTSNLENFQA
jgi:hypothetical protein